MNSNIDFSKLKTCGQAWDTMKNCGDHKICNKCSETIHDFRGMSHWKIAIKHSESKGKLCGIYDKDFQKPAKQILIYQSRKLLSTGIIGLLTATTSIAQSEELTSKIEIVEHSEVSAETFGEVKSEKATKSVHDTIAVRGILRFAETQEPMIGGTVYIKEDNETGTVTGLGGRFELDVTDSLLTIDSITLVAAYIGCETQEILIKKMLLRKSIF